MLIERTTTGDLIFGRVICWKPGAVDEDLTILTLEDEARKIKVLCWNRGYAKLSDRARNLSQGEYVCVRGEFDLGDQNKCVAFDVKKSGIYNVTTLDGRHLNIAYGKIKKIKKYGKGYKIYFPYYIYEKKITRNWYVIKFLGWQTCSYIKSKLNKDSYCIMYLGPTSNIKVDGVRISNSIGNQMLVVA